MSDQDGLHRPFTPQPRPPSGAMCCNAWMRAVRSVIADDDIGGRLWAATLYRCATCRREVVAGFGRAPLAEADENPTDYDRLFAQVYVAPKARAGVVSRRRG